MIPGEKYQSKNLDPDNPFAKPPITVTIMEVKNGYVRYKFVHNGLDNSMGIDQFFEIYEPAPGSYESPEAKTKPKPKRRIEINEDLSPQ